MPWAKFSERTTLARYRTIKPELFADEKLGECSRDARLLFIGLLPFVDDLGRKQYHPRRVRAEVFPHDDLTLKQIDKWVDELVKAGVVKAYTVDEELFIWLPHFLRHQRIDRPSHSDLPAHPDDHYACQCIACKIKNGDRRAPKHYKRESVPAGTPRGLTQNSTNFSEDSTNEFDESPRRGGSICSVGSVVKPKSNTNTAPTSSEDPPKNTIADPPELKPNRAADRRAQRDALEEIATRALGLLKIDANPLIIEALIDSIKMKAHTKECSFELSCQQIVARAALILSGDVSPENWRDWFLDAGYEYVSKGDVRLSKPSFMGRAICGGPRCTEGWEPVTVGDRQVLKRCPDCAALWSDAGA